MLAELGSTQGWLTLAQVVLTGILGVLAYMAKDMIATFKKGLADHEQRLTRHDSDLTQLRTDLQDYNTKEEFLRESNRTRKVLEEINAKLDHDEGAKDAMIQIGTALAAAINRKEQA